MYQCLCVWNTDACRSVWDIHPIYGKLQIICLAGLFWGDIFYIHFFVKMGSQSSKLIAETTTNQTKNSKSLTNMTVNNYKKNNVVCSTYLSTATVTHFLTCTPLKKIKHIINIASFVIGEVLIYSQKSCSWTQSTWYKNCCDINLQLQSIINNYKLKVNYIKAHEMSGCKTKIWPEIFSSMLHPVMIISQAGK